MDCDGWWFGGVASAAGIPLRSRFADRVPFRSERGQEGVFGGQRSLFAPFVRRKGSERNERGMPGPEGRPSINHTAQRRSGARRGRFETCP